jgi:hypothetical protein
MSRRHVGDLVTDDSGKLIGVCRYPQQSAVDADFATGQSERVDRRVVEYTHLPLRRITTRQRANDMCRHAFHMPAFGTLTKDGGLRLHFCKSGRAHPRHIRFRIEDELTATQGRAGAGGEQGQRRERQASRHATPDGHTKRG